MSVRCLDRRRVWCIAGFVLLLVTLQLPGAAQENVNAAPGEPSKASDSVYSLSGTVINSVTGEPLRRAAVQITGQMGRATLTDEGGHFDFEGLAEGQFFVAANKPGFNQTDADPNGVTVGRETAPIVVKMTPWGVIAGRVTTRDGKPLEGFRISLIEKQVSSGHASWMERLNQGVTNEDGEFRIAGLPAGHYYVVVDQGDRTTLGERGVANAREQGYARVLYPGVSDIGAASPVEVIPGREAEVNLSLAAEPLYQVSGVVTPAVTGLQFGRKVGDENDFSVGANVQGGTFQAKVPAGSYVVSGTTPEGMSVSTPGPSVVVSADSADMQIPLAATANIPVRISMEHAGAGSAENISLEQIPGLTIVIEPTSHVAQMARWWMHRPGGIENVEPGTYTLLVHTGLGWWVKSAQCGGVDLLSEDLTVGDAGSPAPIEITLRDDAGLVTGTVAGAEQSSQAEVLLVQTRAKKNNVDQARVIMGAFAFQGVAPGDYAILAIDQSEQIEYANPDVLNLYLSSAQQVHVPARGTATVNLTVTPVKR